GPADYPLRCVNVGLAVSVDVDDGEPAQVDDEITVQALHLLVRLMGDFRILVPDHDQIRHLAPPSVVRGLPSDSGLVTHLTPQVTDGLRALTQLAVGLPPVPAGGQLRCDTGSGGGGVADGRGSPGAGVDATGADRQRSGAG